MKKLAIAAVAGTSLALLVVSVWLVLLLMEENDWIDRCADETSASYIHDEKLRTSECAKTPSVRLEGHDDVATQYR